MSGIKALWICIIGALSGLVFYTDFDLLPAPYQLILESDNGAPASGTGTAFSVGEGVWLTAQHVVNACDAVVFIDDKEIVGLADQVVHHPSADLSLVFSEVSGKPLSITPPSIEFDRHSTAYLFGFPIGKPRSFQAALVEERVLKRENPEEKPFPILVWAEQPRPDTATDYGGLSGGPVLNSRGHVIGLSVGSNPGLGRVLATAPSLIHDMVSGRYLNTDQIKSTGKAEPVFDLDTATLADIEAALLKQGRIRQIYCHVENSRPS